MRAFAVKLVSMLVLVLWWPLSARAECQRPEATALTSETSKLEGQVSVTVASLAGGSLEASGDKARAWETQLPSQSAVDNQWYLFYVCQEYEAHRINKDQYCAISAGIWERIVGHPVESAECAARSAPPSAASTVTLRTTGAEDQPTAAALAASEPVAVPRGRWTVLLPDGRALDVFGPVRLNGKELWYVESDNGCLSVLTPTEGEAWQETMLVGDGCRPWEDVRLTVSPRILVIDAGDTHLELDYIDPAPGRPPDGRWSGTLGFTVASSSVPLPAEMPKGWKVAMEVMGGIAGSSAGPSGFPVELTVDRRGGTVDWAATGCQGKLTEPRTGAGWVQFTERISADSECVDGAKVTLQSLSSDAVLMQWSGGSASAQGMLRLAE